MPLQLTEDLAGQIRSHGKRAYPNECCGILLGRNEQDRHVILEVVPIRNLRENAEEAQSVLPLETPGMESEKNRFLIDPREQMLVEKGARERGLDVLGYFHSHPDHPARPSNYDREHAWPGYSYVIIKVQGGEPQEYTSWQLSDDRSAFLPESIEVIRADSQQASAQSAPLTTTTKENQWA